MANLDLLSLLSSHPIDKIVQSGEIVINHGGAVPLTSTGIQNFPDNRLVIHNEVNTYGRKSFIRAVFSVDGSNWQPIDAPMLFSYTERIYFDNVLSDTYPLAGIRAQVSMGSDDNTIYVRIIGGYFSGNTRVDYNAPYTTAVYSGWTAAPQTIRIKYWMFERV